MRAELNNQEHFASETNQEIERPKRLAAIQQVFLVKYLQMSIITSTFSSNFSYKYSKVFHVALLDVLGHCSDTSGHSFCPIPNQVAFEKKLNSFPSKNYHHPFQAHSIQRWLGAKCDVKRRHNIQSQTCLYNWESQEVRISCQTQKKVFFLD